MGLLFVGLFWLGGWCWVPTMSSSPALPPLPSAFSGRKEFYLANEKNIFSRYKNTFVFVKQCCSPYDPYVFGLPGSASGSVSHKYGSESESCAGSFHHQA
jgi:hypothetical protein